jgi:chromosome segregation ATPase
VDTHGTYPSQVHPRSVGQRLESLRSERDALRDALAQLKAKIYSLRVRHRDGEAALCESKRDLVASESAVDHSLSARNELLPRYDRLAAEELRLRLLLQERGL